MRRCADERRAKGSAHRSKHDGIVTHDDGGRDRMSVIIEQLALDHGRGEHADLGRLLLLGDDEAPGRQSGNVLPYGLRIARLERNISDADQEFLAELRAMGVEELGSEPSLTAPNQRTRPSDAAATGYRAFPVRVEFTRNCSPTQGQYPLGARRATHTGMLREAPVELQLSRRFREKLLSIEAGSCHAMSRRSFVITEDLDRLITQPCHCEYRIALPLLAQCRVNWPTSE